MDDAPAGVLFRVLGPFDVLVDGAAVALGGARQRLVLAALVAQANTVVSADRLIDIVWGEGSTTPVGEPIVRDLNPMHWEATACRLAGRNLTQSECAQYLPGRPYQAICPQWPSGSA